MGQMRSLSFKRIVVTIRKNKTKPAITLDLNTSTTDQTIEGQHLHLSLGAIAISVGSQQMCLDGLVRVVGMGGESDDHLVLITTTTKQKITNRQLIDITVEALPHL